MEQARLLLKGMWDDAVIGLFHVTPKPHLWVMKLLQHILDLRRAPRSAQKITCVSRLILAFPAWSHGNSYEFYEVANSYEFIRPHSYEFVRFLLNRTYFTNCPIRMNSYEWPTPDPAPKPTHHVGLDKSYKFVRVRSYELVRISQLFIIRTNSYELVVR